MNRFLQHLDRDVLTISVSRHRKVIDDIFAICLRAFRVDTKALFCCNHPERRSPRQLVHHINDHIIDTLISERKSILCDLYPDLDFPANFWRSIYIDFEFGDMHYRVFHHYHQWTIHQIKYKSFKVNIKVKIKWRWR